MVEIGRMNMLRAVRKVDFGVFLDGEEDGEILLPNRYVPKDLELGSELEVFVHLDSNDRLVATTEVPFAQAGDFARLEVVSSEKVGAFLNWGLSKDLFLPHAEQTRALHSGQMVIVYIYLDKSARLSASMRLRRNGPKEMVPYQVGEEVTLWIFDKTDLGYKALINGLHFGMLYSKEVFKPLQYGAEVRGYIKKMRDDGKIDLSLQKLGYEAAGDIAPMILSLLEERGGFLDIDDKTPAETIYKLFGVSKNKYKMALGGLYKQRLITIEDGGIRLNKKS